MRETAQGPNGWASIVKEVKFALADIRHKMVEEATYGRAVTPHWRDTPGTPATPGGIHGKADVPPPGNSGIHGKTAAPTPDAPVRGDGGVHGKAETLSPEAAGGVHGQAREPATRHPAFADEPKGLGMSYAELSASWDKAAQLDRPAGRDREPARQQEPAIER